MTVQGAVGRKEAICPESTIESANRRNFIRKAALATAAVGVGSSLLSRNVLPQSSARSDGTVGGCNCAACCSAVVGYETGKNGTGVLGCVIGSGGRGVKGVSSGACGWGVAGHACGTGGTFGVKGIATSTAGHGVCGSVTAAGAVGVRGLACNNCAVPIVARGTSSQNASLQRWQRGCTVKAVVNSCGWFGIGTCTPSAQLDVVGTIKGTFSCGYGVQGVSYKGTGVFGCSCCGIGVAGFSIKAIGVCGISEGSSACGRGVKGRSPCGTGVYGCSNCGTGVKGVSVSGRGVHGSSTKSYGVFGCASCNDYAGVFGCSSSAGIGVLGKSKTGSGVVGCSPSFNGVFGYSNTGNGVLGVSVTGCAVQGSSGGTGVYGTGCDFGVVGVANAPGGIPIVAKGAAGQTANLQQWEANCGTVYAVINKAGSLGLGGVTNPHHVLCISGKAHASSGFSIGPCVCVNTTLAVNGSMAAKTRAVSATTTLLTTDYAILATDTITLTLPPAKTQNGMMIFIKNTSTGTISVVPGGSDTIEGATSSSPKTLGKQYDSLQLISNGSNEWFIVGSVKCGAVIS